MSNEISNTEKMFYDFVDMLVEENNLKITAMQRRKIVKNCFENDSIFDTLYEQIWDEIENVVGSIEG